MVKKNEKKELVTFPLTFFYISSLNAARNINPLTQKKAEKRLFEVKSDKHQSRKKKVYPFYKPIRINF